MEVDQPVFSARAIDRFSPPGSPRTYLLQPLPFLERQAFHAEVTRRAGPMPTTSVMYGVLRVAVRAAAPDNLAEVLAAIDQAEAEPLNAEAMGALTVIEQKVILSPAYAAMIEARRLHIAMLPVIAARHALRGWEGPDLPPYAVAEGDGLVAEGLLDHLHDLGELEAVGWRANALQQPGRAAGKNSPSPSPSSANQAPAKGETSRKAGANGSSRARSSKPTLAG